ncbi:MAG: iron ABC transporter permease [Acidiferrobacterales bacterium]|nr:iron ABC transporter permease [Acidiferrobacterales bacterium]
MIKQPYLPWQVASGLAACLIFLPVATLVLLSFNADNSIQIWSHLSETVLADYTINSLKLGLGVALLTLFLGIGSAWLTSQYSFFGSKVLSWALLLPLAMPTYIIAYSYTGLLDIAGPVQTTIRNSFDLRYGQYWFPEIRSMGGAIFVMSFVLYPYVYLLARASFLEQSPQLRDVARLMGYTRKQTFFLISLPIARPAIVAGVSLVLMETLADFGAVSYFGVNTFTTGIFRTWYGLDSVEGAAQLALMLLGFVIILLMVEKYSRSRARYHTFNSNNHTKKSLVGRKALAAFILASVPLALGFVIPVWQLLVWAIHTHHQLLESSFWSLVKNTFLLALITSVLALLLALLLAYSHRIVANNVTLIARRIASLGYAIPGVVIAVGTLIPLARLDNSIDSWFRANFDYSTGLLISGTITALIIAYLIRFMSVSLRSVESGLANIKDNMDQVSRSLGHAPLATLRQIHIPIMRASLLTALLIVFVDVMKELPATLILRPFNFNTLAVRAYELASDERLADAAMASLTIVLVGLIPVVLLTRAINR